MEVLGITIDPNRDLLFDPSGIKRLKESYMRDTETSPQERFAFVSKTFSSNPEHAQRLYDYSSKHWLSYSTPILAFGKTQRGLPISCYLNYINDSAEGLVDTLSETNWLSMLGGGVGIGFGMRSSDDKSTGVMPHLKMYDASSLAYRQGKTRRGSYAAYLNISHPDILMFLEMRKPTGDQNQRCLNLHHGLNITNDFMELLEGSMIDPEADDDWDLRDPHSNEVIDTVSARDLWQRILEMRMQTGEPYLHFIDTSNEHMPVWLKQRGLEINQSNLCSEIILPTNKDRTAVCCLSSLNLEYYDAWSKDKQFIGDVAEMLDNVLTYFIENAPDAISRAKYSAERERSIGCGALGFHAYLQRKNIPFESTAAKSLNMRVFRHIRKQMDAANIKLGTERGEAPSIEPWRANAYRQDTLSGAYLNKNKYLDLLIKKKCEADSTLDYEKIWSVIISNEGSCQTVKCLSDEEKELYKTSMEIDQRWLIEHAADRQKYIDQAQSLNIFFRPDANIKYLHAVHFLAWKSGLKTLYYCRSEKIGKADKISRGIERNIIKELDMTVLATSPEECLACEG
jgi:ribonucleoside-diphosphate reductase alpha chain